MLQKYTAFDIFDVKSCLAPKSGKITAYSYLDIYRTKQPTFKTKPDTESPQIWL